MRVAETALHSYRQQDRAAGNKAALLLQAVKLLSLLSKCAMPNGGDVSALFEEHMRNAANRRYRTLKSEMQPTVLGEALHALPHSPVQQQLGTGLPRHLCWPDHSSCADKALLPTSKLQLSDALSLSDSRRIMNLYQASQCQSCLALIPTTPHQQQQTQYPGMSFGHFLL